MNRPSDSQALGIAPPGTYPAVLAALGPVRSLRILDVPSGEAGFAARLAAEGAVCVASDLAAPPAYRPAVLANLNSPLPFADASYDAITCIEGLEHAHDPFLVIREFHRLLRPGGRLILSTPNIHNLRSRLKFLLRGTLFWFDPCEIVHIGHVSVVPYFILAHILATTGFTDIRLSANRSIFPALPAWAARAMQWAFSKPTPADRLLNSPALLTGEGLIVVGRKPERPAPPPGAGMGVNP